MLKQAHLTSVVAWSHQSVEDVYLAAGTKAQQLDTTFSTSAELQLCKVDLADTSTTLRAEIQVEASQRFHALTWSAPTAQSPSGLIVGGLDDGAISIWDAQRLFDRQDDALMTSAQHHTGPVYALDINPGQPNLMASASSASEVFVWDLNNPTQHLTPGPKTMPEQDLTDVRWNCQVQHILATTGPSGRTTVWDLKASKPIINLSGGRANFKSKAMAWHPDVATELVVASEDDSYPVIQLWDLRNAQSPVRELQGHTKGILALDWCSLDSNFLLSCGKDNRCLLWNPNEEEANNQLMQELIPSKNWVFEVSWCPRNPHVAVSASFDGEVTVQNAISAPKTSGQELSAPNKHMPAPRWLKRPCGATFSFTGTLSSFNANSRHVRRMTNVADSELHARAEALADCLQAETTEAFAAAAQNVAAYTATGIDAPLWSMISSSCDAQPREKQLSVAGFNSKQVEANVTDMTGHAIGAPPPTDTGVLHAYDGMFSATSSSDHVIMTAIGAGKLDAAIDVCLHEDRMDDALMIAVAGGPDMLRRVQQTYFQRRNSPVSRLLHAVVEQRWVDIVQFSSTADWADTLAVIMTYASPDVLSDLCSVLAQRLEDDGNRMAACLCHICAGSVSSFTSCYERLLSETNTETFLMDLTEKATALRCGLSLQQSGMPVVNEEYTSRVLQLCAELTDQHDAAAAKTILSKAIIDADPLPSGEHAQLKQRLAVAMGESVPPVEHGGPLANARGVPASSASMQASSLFGNQSETSFVAAGQYGSTPAQPTPQQSYNNTWQQQQQQPQQQQQQQQQSHFPSQPQQQPQQSYQPPAAAYAPPATAPQPLISTPAVAYAPPPAATPAPAPAPAVPQAGAASYQAPAAYQSKPAQRAPANKRWNDPPPITKPRKTTTAAAPIAFQQPSFMAPSQASAPAPAAATQRQAPPVNRAAPPPQAAPEPEPVQVPEQYQPLIQGLQALVQSCEAKNSLQWTKKLSDASKRLTSLNEKLAAGYVDDETYNYICYIVQYAQMKDFQNAFAYHQHLMSSTNPDITGQFLLGLKLLLKAAQALL